MEKRSSEIEISVVSKDDKPISVGTGLQTRAEKKTDEVIFAED